MIDWYSCRTITNKRKTLPLFIHGRFMVNHEATMEDALSPNKPVLMIAEYEQSAEIDKLTKALSKFQADCPIVRKTKYNTFFKASYADLGAVIETIKPHLGTSGLAVTQWPVENGYLITQVAHESGQYQRSKWQLKSIKTDPQAIGSALKYQRRYALCAAVGVGEDDEEDDDGNDASTKTGKQKMLEEIGELLRSLPSTKREDVLKDGGFCKIAEIQSKDEAYLRRVYIHLGGDTRMAAIKAAKE